MHPAPHRLLTRFTLLAGTLAVLGSSSAAFAQQPSFGIDVPNGKYDILRLDDLGPVVGIETTLEITELRFGFEWNPTFSVMLEADDIGLGVRWVPQRGKPIVPKLIAYRGKSALVDQDIPEVPLKREEKFQLRLDWSQDGVLQMRINSHSINAKMPFAPRVLTISASSGEIVGHRIAFIGASTSK